MLGGERRRRGQRLGDGEPGLHQGPDREGDAAVPFGRCRPGVGAGDDADPVGPDPARLLDAVRVHGREVQPDPLHDRLDAGWHLVGGRHLVEVEPQSQVDGDRGRGDRLQQLVGHVRARLGQAAEVLEPVDTGANGVPHPGQRVGVGQHLEPCVVPCGHRRGHLLGAELLGVHIGPDGGHATARHHLQHVDPADHVLGDLVAHAIDANRNTAEVVAVAVGDGQRRAGRGDPRQPREGAGLEGAVPAVAEVLDGGDPARDVRGQ